MALIHRILDRIFPRARQAAHKHSVGLMMGAVAAGAGVFGDLRANAGLENYYDVECHDKNGNLLWTDTIKNVVTTVGKNDILTQYLKGSAYTAAPSVGLVTGVDAVPGAITKANPASVNATGHGFATGQTVKASGIGGMTQLNGNSYVVTVTDANNFTIAVDSTGFSVFTSGGLFTLQPGAAADTTASHTLWTECQAYAEATRQTWTGGTASAGSIDNSAAKAVFTCNADGTKIGGCFLNMGSNTKGGTTGTLYGVGPFTGGDKVLSNGDTVSVTVTATAT